MLRVGLIFGGKSTEHHVSVASALSIINHYDSTNIKLDIFGVTEGGAWLSSKETHFRLEKIQESGWGSLGIDTEPNILHNPDVISGLEKCDVIFPIIHGSPGEDGTLQGLLSFLGKPYVGSDVSASAAGMNKATMRALFTAHGISQTRYLTIDQVSSSTELKLRINDIESELTYPLFVKPASAGSSIGVSKANNSKELLNGLIMALEYDSKLLVEEALTGRELECAVVELDDLIATPLGEIKTTNEFYDYSSKYTDESSTIIVPAVIKEQIQYQIQTIALRAFQAVGARGYARVDFFLSDDEAINCIEINTHPGFTSTSMFPKLCSEFGLDYPDLISALVTTASQATPRGDF